MSRTVFVLISVILSQLIGMTQAHSAEVAPLVGPGRSAGGRQIATAAAGIAENGLSNTTVLIVRHAEKPDDGTGLTPAGEARAAAYADYFRRFRFNSAVLRVDTLVAAADTDHSERPRLTLTPLSQATAIPVEQPSASDDVGGLARWLRAGRAKRTILVSWHHSKISQLVGALGADPSHLLFLGWWPASVYNWVVVLHFDAKGDFVPAASGLVKEEDLLAG